MNDDKNLPLCLAKASDNCYNDTNLRLLPRTAAGCERRRPAQDAERTEKRNIMDQLEILRESLGQCDEILLDALLMRNRVVEDIMAYKEKNDIPILQPEQEAKQREWLKKRMEGKRHTEEVAAVFEEITRNSKRIQARKLFDYNIVLIGFMGAGKSTISDFLRTVFAMEVVEMDQIIAERQGMSISDIFETYGEEYFRDLETNLRRRCADARAKCRRDEEKRPRGTSDREAGDDLKPRQGQSRPPAA